MSKLPFVFFKIKTNLTTLSYHIIKILAEHKKRVAFIFQNTTLYYSLLFSLPK